MPNNKLEHVPDALKHLGDVGAWTGSVMASVMSTMTPILQFGILALAFIWGYYRVHDIILGIKLKKLKIRRHEDL